MLWLLGTLFRITFPMLGCTSYLEESTILLAFTLSPLLLLSMHISRISRSPARYVQDENEKSACRNQNGYSRRPLGPVLGLD